MRAITIYIFLVFLVTIGCEKEAKLTPKFYPFITTKPVTDIDSTGATFNAEILDKGKDTITDYGFKLIDGNNNFQISLAKIAGTENLKLRVNADLADGKTYTVRAYVKTDKYIVLGNIVSFTSLGSMLPEIKDFSPGEGFDGTLVTLVGKHFSYIPSNNKVYVGNNLAEVVYSKGDTIVFKIPSIAIFGDAEISVRTGISEVVTAGNKFRIIGPSIDSLSKSSGFSGEYMTIWGKNFTRNGNKTSVLFGKFQAEIISCSDIRIDIVIPTPFFNYSDLLMDNTASIRVINGLKAAVSNEFIIRKSWERKNAPPFKASWSENCFSYNGKGYFLDINYRKLYEYDPISDNWSPISDYPGERSESNHFAVFGGKLLKLGGSNYLGKMYSFWEYDFATRTWLKREDTSFGFYKAASFVLNNTLYIITDNNQVWSYGNDRIFRRMNDFPEQVRIFITYLSQNKVYLVNSGQTWEYDAQRDTWIKKWSNAFLVGNYYQSTIGFNLNGTGYVIHSGTDLYKFDTLNERWVLTSRYPFSGYNVYKSSFVIGNKAYVAALDSHYAGEAPLLFMYQEK
jgi:hypothetical protein